MRSDQETGRNSRNSRNSRNKSERTIFIVILSLINLQIQGERVESSFLTSILYRHASTFN